VTRQAAGRSRIRCGGVSSNRLSSESALGAKSDVYECLFVNICSAPEAYNKLKAYNRSANPLNHAFPLITTSLVFNYFTSKTLMWVYYQQISNCCRPVSTDRLTPPVTDRLLIMSRHDHFVATAFLCRGSCVRVGHGIFFYTANVNNFLLVN